MIIYHDTSYVKPSNAKWIAKGYAMEDIYSLRLQFLYTEAQQEENRMAHAAGIRDTVQLRQAAEHRNAVMAPIMAAIAHNFICSNVISVHPLDALLQLPNGPVIHRGRTLIRQSQLHADHIEWALVQYAGKEHIPFPLV